MHLIIFFILFDAFIGTSFIENKSNINSKCEFGVPDKPAEYIAWQFIARINFYKYIYIFIANTCAISII